MIFQFPISRLGMPAILKGRVDRVFAVGRAYGGGRYFGKGVFNGKRAFCAVTVGGPTATYSEIGIYGPIEPILFPIHHGIPAFCGFTVIEPFVVYGPARMSDAERTATLKQYGDYVLNPAARQHSWSC